MNKKIFIHQEDSLKPAYKIKNQSVEIQELSEIPLSESDRICVINEACLDTVYEKLPKGKKKTAIEKLKNKFYFRQAISPLFPSFYFHKTQLNDLSFVPKKVVIKPMKGFFSAGVRTLDPSSDLEKVKWEIQEEVNRLSTYFPESILSSTEWLIEEYIEGEEIAVDMYYDETGKPVILNITQHPMPDNPRYLNAIYWTSETLFNKLKKPLETFFQFLNDHVLQVSDFPIHGEFRIQNDVLIPIELNPLRFGGFGLADLTYYGLGYNPYDYFFEGKHPNWEDIWETRKDQFLCWVLGYNGTEVDLQTATVDHESFIAFCKEDNLLHYRRIDPHTHPVFAIGYLATHDPHMINAFTSVDFNRFFLEQSPAPV